MDSFYCWGNYISSERRAFIIKGLKGTACVPITKKFICDVMLPNIAVCFWYVISFKLEHVDDDDVVIVCLV